MRRSQAGLIALLLAAATTQAADFSGASALQLTGKLVAFGPRPAGSPAIEKLRAFLRAQLKPLGCEVIEDAFTGKTPLGPVEMKNVIARFPGSSGRAVVFSGHYDTKPMPGITFVGANDGGSSAGLLLELARALAGRPRKDDVYLVWFDGEEAFAQWSETDSLYGSRHLARKWSDDGMLSRIKALINVDMTGDKDLGILQELNSSVALRRLVWRTAADTGYGKYFLDSSSAIDDDHMPFVRLGVNALDLIDFSYGPSHSWWHNEHDTLDKISAQSFDVVGNVLLEVLRRLEQ